MPKIETNSADTATAGPGNQALANSAAVLGSMRFFELQNFKDYLGDAYFPSLVAFSKTCKAARNISSDVRKRYALQRLVTALQHYNKKLFRNIISSYPIFLDQKLILTAIEHVDVDLFRKVVKSPLEWLTPTVVLKAVVHGNEDFVREIVRLRPELLLDSSAIVTDVSGKEIKGLTPLQAAICTGDVEMAEMLKGFMPADEVLSQFEKIYPNGIDAVEAAQKDAAQGFKTTKLRAIFNAINAPDADVAFELETPGQRSRDSALNHALHTFREDFAYTSNNEQIFNPYYLLSAFEFYVENNNAFIDDHRRDLFWRQITGYMQCHLSACYLQAFARSIYDIVEHGAELERTFEFHYWKGHYIRRDGDTLNNLGYRAGWPPLTTPWLLLPSRFGWCVSRPAFFSKFIANKKIRFGELTQPQSQSQSQSQQLQGYLPTRCVIA